MIAQVERRQGRLSNGGDTLGKTKTLCDRQKRIVPQGLHNSNRTLYRIRKELIEVPSQSM